MLKHAVLLAALVLGGMVILDQAKTSESNLSDATVQAILQKRIDQEKQSLGIVVGWIDPQGRKIISYGRMAQSDLRTPDGDTIFEIGSISKVFTALLLADGVKQGEVKLNDPISKFLPKSVKVPHRNGKEITLIDLATHTSGLPRLPDNLNSKDIENPYANYTIEQLYEFLSSYQLTREIGTKYEYSNLGFGLLGHILNLKSGMDYETLVTTRITQPLQMRSTKIQLSSEMRSRLATGHNEIGKPVKNWDIPTLSGAGALRSTTHDLLNFLAANLGLTQSTLFPAMQRTQNIQRQTGASDLGIGLGWHLYQKYGTEIVWHSGQTGGYHSFIGFDRKKQWGVVVLSNSSNSIDDIGLHLLKKQFPLEKHEPPKERKVIALNPKFYEAYVGRYELSPSFTLTITKAGDRLFAQATGQRIVELFPELETNFFIKEVDAQITFVKDQQGQVNQLILHQSGQNIPAKRIR
ncbi:MAG: serine hydrolase [Plectolyngbya sp. WJT66-NPBG17]|jgi:CubicO group peptidase (beta-lactamase class C family)|nr:serine hydrolase [Plectolyngbya sp. WJT66-NPBG17]